jgi:uncharacterized membrane protein (UPF0127 family)
MTRGCDNEGVSAEPGSTSAPTGDPGAARGEPAWGGEWRPGRLFGWTRRSAWILLAAGVASFLVQGANRPANPYLVPANGPVPTVALSSFPTVSLAIAPRSQPRPVGPDPCFLAATTTAEQETGLMGQTSLHGYAGMVFLFPQPTTDAFYMRSTPVPLSIAWFDARGDFISSSTMPPCPSGTAACPTYGPGRPYLMAVEVPAGRLARYGIGPGSAIRAAGPCRP